MTVRDLIEELEELPMDLPVVIDYQEVSEIDIEDDYYYLDKHTPNRYSVGPVVVLE